MDRIDDVHEDHFEFEIQTEEALQDFDSAIQDETFYWAALEANPDSDIFEQGSIEVSSSLAKTGAFLSDGGMLFADMQDLNGANTATVSYCFGKSGQIKLKIQEESSSDSELNHISETVDWFIVNEGVYVMEEWII